MTGKPETEDLALAIVRQLREKANLAIPLPLFASREMGSFAGRMLSSSGEQAARRAYRQSLPEPVRKRISRLMGLFGGACCVGFVGGSMLAFSDVFPSLCRRLHPGLNSGTVYLIPQDPASIGGPWMFAGPILLGWLAYRLGWRMAGSHRKEWREYVLIGTTPKMMAVLKYVGAGVVVAAMIATPLGIGSYARVTERGIAINSFFGFGERFYAWSEIRDVRVSGREYVDHGKVRRRDVHVVEFSDGRLWQLDEAESTRFQHNELAEAISYISARVDKARADQ